MMLTTERERTNPYIVGPPIDKPELFFGRRKLFKFIEDNLKQNVQVILLHGQRRIGKSSVLMQIPNFVGLDEFVFIYFDLHDKTRLPLDDVLLNLTKTIIDKLKIPIQEILPEVPINIPEYLNRVDVSPKDYTDIIFEKILLPEFFDFLAEKNQKMVWLLDEFDVLNNQVSDSSVDSFFPYLQTLINQYKNLYIIPVIGRRIEDLNNFKSLFKQAPNQEIGLLDKLEAKELITKPVEGYLTYNSEAIKEILELTSGHPYLTMAICNALFSQAEAEDKLDINRDDVNNIIDDVLELAEAGLTWFRDGLPIPERVVFSAVAQAEKMADKEINSVIEEPLKLLREYGVKITEELSKAPENLVNWGFLERLENAEFRYKVKVKIVRYWLVKRYPLRQAIWDLEKVDLDACKLFELAEDIYQHRNLSASSLYEPILELNPNHFTALFKLAEGYLDTKEFKKALHKYERANQIDPTRTNDEYKQLRRKKLRIWWGENFAELILGLSGFIILVTIGSLASNIQQLSKDNARLTAENTKLTEDIARLTEAYSKYEPNATVIGIPGVKNLRSGAGLEYGIVGNVTTGDRVQVIDSTRNSDNFPWYKIRDPQSGAEGWIPSNLLSVDVQPSCQPPAQLSPSPPNSKNNTNATVGGQPGTKNLRSGPGTICRVIGTVHTGDRILVLGSAYDGGGYQWYKVYHPKSGVTGWLSAQLVARDLK